MKPIKIFFDKVGNTLNVWFDDPKKEAIAEETSEEIVILKDKKGKVIGFENEVFRTSENFQFSIGFEVLNYLSSSDLRDLKKLPVETEILA